MLKAELSIQVAKFGIDSYITGEDKIWKYVDWTWLAGKVYWL